MKLSNNCEALEHLRNDEIQKSWTEFQQLIVEEPESPKNADLIEPRKPWISDATINLIKNRASTKKLLLENEDKAKQHIYATELWELRRKIKASARKDKRKWLKGITEDIEKAGNTGNSEKVFEQATALNRALLQPRSIE